MVDDICATCGEREDSESHIFKDCAFANQVWSLVNMGSFVACLADPNPRIYMG